MKSSKNHLFGGGLKQRVAKTPGTRAPKKLKRAFAQPYK